MCAKQKGMSFTGIFPTKKTIQKTGKLITWNTGLARRVNPKKYYEEKAKQFKKHEKRRQEEWEW